MGPHRSFAARALARLVASARSSCRVVLVALLVTLTATGCKSWYPVDTTTDLGLATVAVGEHVRVATHGGERREFDVTEVTPTRIAGDNAAYTAPQIATLERLETHVLRSTAAGVGVSSVAAVVFAFVAAPLIVAAMFGG